MGGGVAVVSVFWLVFIGGMVVGFFLGIGATLGGIQWMMGNDPDCGPKF